MTNLRTIRSFSMELMKIASSIKDADIQKLLADRKGKEYLVGGQLYSNQDEALYLPKMASFGGGYDRPMGMVGLSSSVSGNFDLKARKKKSNHYQTARDYAMTGVKGGLTGLGILGASNALKGRFGAPKAGIDTIRAAKQARRAATIGSSAALIDRAYRHDDLTKQSMIQSNPNSPFISPAKELAEEQETGSFESRVLHNIGKPPKTFQIGQKFRLPQG